MKNKSIISLVITIASIIVTVFLFYYWSDEENRDALFKFNLGYALFLEILFFGFIHFTKLSSKKILGATYSILGIIVLYYLLFGIAILLVFNILFVHIISTAWYYSFIILGSLIAVVLIGFSLKLNYNVVDSNERREKFTETRTSYVQNLTYLHKSYEAILKDNEIYESFESDYSTIIQKLTNKLSFINPKSIEDPATNQKLTESISALDKLVNEMKDSSSDKTSIQKQITALVNDTIFYLNSLK